MTPSVGAMAPDRSGLPRRARPGRGGTVRRSTRLVGGLSLAILTLGGLGHTVITGVDERIGRVKAVSGIGNRPDGTRGTNFLLVGTDGRSGLAAADKQRFHLGGAPCHCTDTIMLAHL